MSSHDEQLADALELLMAQLQAGQNVSLDESLKAHPEIADELRALWGTVLVAENLGLPDREQPVSMAQADAVNTYRPEFPRPMGEYELLAEIGRGGMGVVFRARQRRLQRIVAVKMLLRGDLAAPLNLLRFQKEAQAAARLDHPNIVAVYDVGAADGQPYFSMPLIDGTTLAKRIADGILSEREAAELLIPVSRAVAYAHQRGILHRDLKPSNILIDRNGRPYISDFGLAKYFSPDDPAASVASMTESGAILGTPGYMAPEQAAASRGEIGPAADIYSIGAILYACVTGRAPFQAANPVDALLMILEQDPPAPRLLNPQIDLDLEMIILKSLQKPIDLRYETADELADDLQAYLNNEPVSARSSHFSQVLVRAFRPTHQVGVLENWGRLWMLHAVVVFLLCVITDLLKHGQVSSRIPYIILWTFGLGAWALVFWNLRRRSGPVTFVERQIAHVWAASMACSTALFGIEWLLQLPVLTLSPVLALFAGAVFIVKAGMLSGEFYLHALALFLAAIPMALFPAVSLTLFGLVSGGAFFISGLKFDKLRRRSGKAK